MAAEDEMEARQTHISSVVDDYPYFGKPMDTIWKTD